MFCVVIIYYCWIICSILDVFARTFSQVSVHFTTEIWVEKTFSVNVYFLSLNRSLSMEANKIIQVDVFPMSVFARPSVNVKLWHTVSKQWYLLSLSCCLPNNYVVLQPFVVCDSTNLLIKLNVSYLINIKSTILCNLIQYPFLSCFNQMT